MEILTYIRDPKLHGREADISGVGSWTSIIEGHAMTGPGNWWSHKYQMAIDFHHSPPTLGAPPP